MSVELILGDCLEIMHGMPDKSVDAVITDPPYGIDYQSARRTDKSQWKPKIKNDDAPFLDWLPDAYRITKDGGALLCFCRWDVEQEFKKAIESAGFSIKSQVIWDKSIHGMGDLESSFAPRHENIWFATKGNFIFPGIRPQSIIKIPRVSAEKLLHPNEKPQALFHVLARSVVLNGGIFCDPFFGSGASAIGAIHAKLNYIGIEIDPYYFKIAERRIAEAQLQPMLFDHKEIEPKQNNLFEKGD
jgi:site-specific DNA-methyltransferase (adenine-specific)